VQHAATCLKIISFIEFYFQICASPLKSNKMNSNNIPDISYFRLSLMAFLRESHPERLKDNRFILSLADAATDIYAQAILNGDTPEEAIEQANAALFDGLQFSKHNTLVNILWNEFSNEVPEDDAKEMAMKILPECESVFAQYSLSDAFAYEPEYELLYTELTGTIAILIENGELIIENSKLSTFNFQLKNGL
jgi:hypothetical protein